MNNMAHHYAGGTPEEHELEKQQRLDYVAETILMRKKGELSFEGIREALNQDIRKDATAKIEAMELAKKDNNYFDVLETVAHSETEYDEEMARESNLTRNEFFQTVGKMSKEGYLVHNGSTELTEKGEHALSGSYILMEENN